MPSVAEKMRAKEKTDFAGPRRPFKFFSSKPQSKHSPPCRMEDGVASVICDLLEVAIHTILYVRSVYPATIFERRKKYGVPVQMSRHPELNQYIADSLTTIHHLLQNKNADAVVIVIQSLSGVPLERFVFEFEFLERSLADAPDLEHALRAILLKLSVCDAALSPNPAECTFAILAHTTAREASRAAKEPFAWVTSEPLLPAGATVVPLRTADLRAARVQVLVQEAADKPSRP
eukprot:m.156810 g.156810  ORF g.156810 m.156810 type:complete len:233 (-) comp15158_c0_seq8:42-740(-)